ncbi:calcium-binding protein [Nocardioides renjunii]|uniref:hypothetical protein n=1 Tax=Nocardioides renjunii TaxID=3095075 RepID=UPI002AFFF0E8|nr:hypothetical protein [Nocardioides sp. S-34]WQQ22681.1 hypothetical protein SHK17_01590 [Nocardioides sp. S-34]
MRRTTLTAAGLLGLALLAPTTVSGPASAAAETCQGRPATVVGTADRPVAGTDGPDVVVSNGATRVDTLGGDDLVCISGERHPYLLVDTGAGNDAVDGTVSPRQAVFATLGTGADSFLGGGAEDRITVSYPDATSATADVVDGGEGSDALFLTTGPGSAVVDNLAGRFTSDGVVRTTWSGLEEFWTGASTEPRPLTFVGSDAHEVVVDRSRVPSQVDVALGRGDDTFRTGAAPLEGSRVQGGSGRDLLGVTSVDVALEVDLKRYRIVVDAPTSYRVIVPDFEDAEVVAPELLLRGDPDRNTLGFTACRAVVKGREGGDSLRRTYDPIFEPDLDCQESARIDGGPGADAITGTRGNDVVAGNDGRDVLRGGNGTDRLTGGGDRDRADGGLGRDRCAAERERRCER